MVAALDRAGVRRGDAAALLVRQRAAGAAGAATAYPDDLKLTDFNQPLAAAREEGGRLGGRDPRPRPSPTWPGRIAAAGGPRPPSTSIDWFPTLARLLQGPGEAGEPIAWDGVDLGPALFDGERLAPRDLYWIWNTRTNRWALRHGDWKIVAYGREEPDAPEDWGLYHLTDDPREQTDVAAEHPEVLAEMHRRFVAQRSRDAR